MLGYIPSMRFNTISEIKKDLKTYGPIFKWAGVVALIFGFAWSLMLAQCMHQSVVMAVEMWLLVLPIIWLLANGMSWLAQDIIDRAQQFTIDIPPARLAAPGWIPSNRDVPIPTSPPRFCLAIARLRLPQ
jgi:hypothetical protein